jgi:hypothetical protein
VTPLVVSIAIYGVPIFFFELTMGLWLLLKGLLSDDEHNPGR